MTCVPAAVVKSLKIAAVINKLGLSKERNFLLPSAKTHYGSLFQ